MKVYEILNTINTFLEMECELFLKCFNIFNTRMKKTKV